MAIRANHYDAAFEEYLRQQRIPYVVVNEARRSPLDAGSLKSLDFVVCSPTLGGLLIDVKGRCGPQRGAGGARAWENWATADDLESMTRWETAFGQGYRALLVFAYWLPEGCEHDDLTSMLTFRNRDYAFYGVWAADYRQAMRVRSPKWETVWLRSPAYRDLRFSLAEWAPPV
jgi:hypothetical protein